MKTNIGTIDRVVRISAGLLLLTSVFALEGNIRWFGLVGLVPLITAFAGWCPLIRFWASALGCPVAAGGTVRKATGLKNRSFCFAAISSAKFYQAYNR